MLILREALLRTPLGLTFSEQDLQKEISDLFIGCFLPEENVLVGCCVLTPVDERLVRLRQMAVIEKYQRKGIGRQLVAFAEKEALKSGFAALGMHARATAIPFYEQLGYKKKGEEFTEVSIPHFLMIKALK